MDPLTRMLIALAVGIVVYGLYWLSWRRAMNIHPLRWSWSEADRSLRRGTVGTLRVLLGWGLAFTAYAVVIEDDGTPFSAHWWHESLLGGDWIGVLVFSAVMTFAECHRASRTPTKQTQPPQAVAD